MRRLFVVGSSVAAVVAACSGYGTGDEPSRQPDGSAPPSDAGPATDAPNHDPCDHTKLFAPPALVESLRDPARFTNTARFTDDERFVVLARDARIFAASRESRDDAFGPAASLAALESGEDSGVVADTHATVSSNGLTIIFTSSRVTRDASGPWRAERRDARVALACGRLREEGAFNDDSVEYIGAARLVGRLRGGGVGARGGDVKAVSVARGRMPWRDRREWTCADRRKHPTYWSFFVMGLAVDLGFDALPKAARAQVDRDVINGAVR